jgi:hypothetical protein
MDTHRVFETLLMKSVPVVLTSSLDRLYQLYPIAIVQQWEDAFDMEKMREHKKKIQEKFGDDPFDNKAIKDRLTIEYWVSVIRGNVPFPE